MFRVPSSVNPGAQLIRTDRLRIRTLALAISGIGHDTMARCFCWPRPKPIRHFKQMCV